MKNLDKQKPNYLVTKIITSSKKINSLIPGQGYSAVVIWC